MRLRHNSGDQDPGVQPSTNVSTKMRGSPILLPNEVLFMQFKEEPYL
jgi:hypothetical protein